MKDFHTILILIVSMILSFGTNAQPNYGTIVGKITDADTGEPIIFGPVVLLKNGVQISVSQTDIDGSYILENIHPGIYTMDISYVGYQSQITDIILVESATVIKRDIELGASILLDGEELITCCMRLIDHTSHQPGRIITADDIKALPLIELNKHVQNTSGVNVFGISEQDTEYHIVSRRVDGKLVPKKVSRKSEKKSKTKSKN